MLIKFQLKYFFVLSEIKFNINLTEMLGMKKS